jgi:hypothetical protein
MAVSLLQAFDKCSELEEELALQKFGKKVADHFFCETAFNRKFIHVDSVGDETELAIEMLGSLQDDQGSQIKQQVAD